MRVESAGFGEVHGGHALLGSSDVERSRYCDIVSKTDRPGYAPPGLTWSPYISGFPWRGHYYLVKTFPDSSASRSGMVFSYALELNLEEISHCSALGKLTDLLSATVTKPAEYKSIEIATGLSDSTTGVDGRLAECLVSAQSGESVVWLGEGGFVDAITALWACMWPETRATFSFRLAFDPQDLDVDHPTLVLTPSQLESRWAEHPIVQRSTQTVTTAGSALARQPGGEALRALKQSIGARILHPRELRLLEQVYSTLTAATTSTAQGRSALHLIGRLCPSPKNGGPEKSQLFQLTAAAVAAEEDAAEIRAFRNLDLEAFEDPQALLVAIEEWISKNILRDSQDKTLGSILELAFEGQHYLSDRVRNGLRMSLQGRKEKDVNVFWAWMQGTPNHAGDLMELAVSSGWSDTLLASGCPSLLDKRVGDMLLPFTREHDLSVCYSAIAAATLRPEEAIRSYLELGITLPHPASGMLIDRIGAPAVVQFAKTSDDVRGTSLALEALHGNPALLQPVDLDSANWMRLFTSAVRSDIQISKLLSGRSDSFKVFDSVLTGGILDSVSWEALSESEFSNIVDYQQRSALCAHIPAPHRAQFLLGTAKGWLELFANHPDAPHEIESELDSVVLRTVRGQYFDVATLVRLCYALSSLD